MSPLERVIPMKGIGKIRIECVKCHSAMTFTARAHHILNVGESCPICHDDWGDAVEHILRDLTTAIRRNDDVKGCVISLEPDEAF